MEVRSLRGLALAVTALVIVDALNSPVILAWLLIDPAAVSNAYDLAILSGLATKLITFIVFGRWIYVAGDNLVRAGYDDLEFTPGSRIWWFAVPLANLVQPLLGMRELWNASHGNAHDRSTPPLLGVWWALWLGGSIAPYIATLTLPAQGYTGQLIVGGLFDALLAAAALMLVHGITDAQRALTRQGLEEVFA